MKWEGGEESENVEDERGGGGGGGGVQPGHIALGGGTILVLIVGYFLGVSPQQLLGLLQGGRPNSPSGQVAPTAPPVHDRAEKFIATILGYTEKVWDEQFQKMGKRYEHQKVHIFSGQTETACGPANSSTGPFYCPADRKVYIDPAFYDELEQQLGGSKADFSQAYVIAHEIGHHVQQLLGYGAIIDEKRRTLSTTEFNKWSVRLELQADYLAGVWAHYGNEKFKFIENGDVEAAIKSANSIGDDTLQKEPADESRRRITRTAHPRSASNGTNAASTRET